MNDDEDDVDDDEDVPEGWDADPSWTYDGDEVEADIKDENAAYLEFLNEEVFF